MFSFATESKILRVITALGQEFGKGLGSRGGGGGGRSSWCDG